MNGIAGVPPACGPEARGPNSKTTPRPKAPVGGSVVDIAETGDEPDRDPLRQVAQDIVERMRGRPAYRAEQRRQLRASPRPDQPEAAIFGRPEHQVTPPEQPEGGGDLRGAEPRQV